MAFGSSRNRNDSGTSRSDSPYLKLLAGDRVIRILDMEEKSYWRYWINVNVGGRMSGRSIVVAMDNPIKRMMESIGKDAPSFRKVEKRMLLNVLDRTPIVRWGDGTTIYADANNVFVHPETGKPMLNPAVIANNRVMILDFGANIMDQLIHWHNRIVNRADMSEKLPIWRFDLRISTIGSGKDVKRIITPDFDQEVLPSELASLPRYDLDKLARIMPNDAVQKILDGVDYNEVVTELGWERVVPLWN